MPAGDRTGFRGMGPLTGRGAGHCKGSTIAGFLNSDRGRARRRERGGRGGEHGRGWRHQFHATGLPFWARPDAPAPADAAESEGQALKTQADHMEQALGEIRRRISELETSQAKEDGNA